MNYQYRPTPTRIKYEDIAEKLRNNPGTHILVRTAPTESAAWAAAQQIKTGRRAAFRPAGHYDAHTQGRDVIATYTGENP